MDSGIFWNEVGHADSHCLSLVAPSIHPGLAVEFIVLIGSFYTCFQIFWDKYCSICVMWDIISILKLIKDNLLFTHSELLLKLGVHSFYVIALIICSVGEKLSKLILWTLS